MICVDSLGCSRASQPPFFRGGRFAERCGISHDLARHRDRRSQAANQSNILTHVTRPNAEVRAMISPSFCSTRNFSQTTSDTDCLRNSSIRFHATTNVS